MPSFVVQALIAPDPKKAENAADSSSKFQASAKPDSAPTKGLAVAAPAPNDSSSALKKDLQGAKKSSSKADSPQQPAVQATGSAALLARIR